MAMSKADHVWSQIPVARLRSMLCSPKLGEGVMMGAK